MVGANELGDVQRKDEDAAPMDEKVLLLPKAFFLDAADRHREERRRREVAMVD